MLIRVIDLETSGFAGGNPPNMPVEAAWHDVVAVSPGNYLITNHGQTLLNPGRSIERGAFETHGISESDVKDAPPARFASNFIHYNTTIDFIVAHNWRFESNWIEPRGARPICTLICAKEVFKGFRNYKNKNVFDELHCEEVADMTHVTKLHRALADTFVTAHILLKLLEKHTPHELALITAGKPIADKLNFGKFKNCKIDDPIVDTPYLEWLIEQKWINAETAKMTKAELERRKR